MPQQYLPCSFGDLVVLVLQKTKVAPHFTLSIMKWEKILLSQAFNRRHGHCCTEKGPCGTGTDCACVSTCTMTQLATVQRSERDATIFAYPGRYTINSYELSILSQISIVSPRSTTCSPQPMYNLMTMLLPAHHNPCTTS